MAVKNLKLSDEQTLQLLLDVLDNLDTKILVIDKEGNFRYFNQRYQDYYGAMFAEQNKISPEEVCKLNLFEMKSRDAEILTDAIRAAKAVEKFYNEPTVKEEHNVFTDIYPLHVSDEFWGIMVVEHNTELVSELSNQLNYYKSLNSSLKQQLNNKKELPAAYRNVIGESSNMMRVLEMCAHVAPTHSSVCLLGESGTGKEVLAEAIHKSSKQVDGPMIKVNCAAIPENLIESELFGYEGGAFTGANPHGKAGKFELANGGTLFLDEIGEMPLAMQAKLLRVIQEREITRIGGSKTIKLNFRLVTATNRNLEKMIEEGTFREDLFYRICVIPINIPPLRERRDDIPLLANEFLNVPDLSFGEQRSFSDAVMNQMKNYKWPGNIRELKNCVERMAVLCPNPCIDVEYLPLQITKSALKEHGELENQYNLHEIIEKVEYNTIKTVLGMVNGNKSKATEVLGISKRNLYMKMEKFGLK